MFCIDQAYKAYLNVLGQELKFISIDEMKEPHY